MADPVSEATLFLLLFLGLADGVELLGCLLDLVFDFVHALAETLHSLAESVHELRDFLASEEEKEHEDNEKDLPETQTAKKQRVSQHNFVFYWVNKNVTILN